MGASLPAAKVVVGDHRADAEVIATPRFPTFCGGMANRGDPPWREPELLFSTGALALASR